MSATLKLINNFVMELNGITYSGKQGASTDEATDTKDVTVNGQVHPVATQLATGAAVTVWSSAGSQPTAFQYLFIWADVDIYVQLIGSATNFIVKLLAGVPFVIPGYGKLKATANTTKIAGTEPTMEDIASIVLQNNSGGPANYLAAVVN